MKPVYKCDYCDKMGTEDEIREHEAECPDNYTLRHCSSCVNRTYNSKIGKFGGYECKAGKEIPEGKQFVNCDLHEPKEKPKDDLLSIFGGLFG